eukprot:10896535-Prorocentrum_lima.AAC.1
MDKKNKSPFNLQKRSVLVNIQSQKPDFDSQTIVLLLAHNITLHGRLSSEAITSGRHEYAAHATP